ncbi:phosphotransferase family protein [Priestia koreensis]|uniref:phosphotransferase family protein n=1 Tax=Priestia koreensis TaxID=284581 RepID=UPI003CFF3987
MAQIIPVRKGEELDTKKLEQFLHEHLSLPSSGSLVIEQFGTGASNLTYTLKIGEWEAVLRRPPLGPVAPKAHDMEREYRILHSLHSLFPYVPMPYIFSDNALVVGAPFFIMERKYGVTLDTEFPATVEESIRINQHVSELMVDTLVSLHEVDYKKTELVNISKPDGFMERQVHGWIQRYERSKTDEINEVDMLVKWLASRIPANSEATVIHYDYKLNNVLFTPDLNEMTGVFDWEMATVGDPLADLGVVLGYWMEDSDPPMLKKGFGKPPVTVRDGFYSRSEFIERYAKKSNRDVSNIAYYETFAYFKLAVICQQIYYRYKKGQTNDKRFEHFGTFVRTLIGHALETSIRK